MALYINPELPAARRLAEAGHTVRPANNCDHNPINIAIINLMPLKDETEYDFLQLMATETRAIRITLIETASHRSRHTPKEHLDKFYTTFNRIAPEFIDGIIITGAPLESVPFEDVDYWDEITGIFNTIRQNKIPSLFICWAAFAAMYHWHRIDWKILPDKISGVFAHKILQNSCPLMDGVSDGFTIPHSRFATWDMAELMQDNGIRVIAAGDTQGAYMIQSLANEEFYISGHGEYSPMTLDAEYRRDLGRGLKPHIPDNYYPGNDPSATPVDTWHETARCIMHNWINMAQHHKQNKQEQK